MKKLYTITILLILLSMIIGAQDLTGEKPPYIFGDEIKINDDTDINISQGVPQVAVYEDNVYITWFDNRDNTNGNSDAYFAKSTDTGGNFSENKKIGDQTGSLDDIEVGPTGNIYGIFAYYGNISFMKSTNEGDTFSDPINVNDEESDGGCSFPAIAVDNEDNIYVVWQDYRNHLPSKESSNPDIYLAKSNDGGESFGPNIRVNDDISLASQCEPDIAVSEDGEVYVVWQDFRNDQPGGDADWDIYFAKSSNGGISFDDNVMLSHDETYSSQSNPRIATDSSGNIYVVWADQRPGQGDESGNYKIYFSKSINRGLSFESDIFIIGGPVGARILADDKGVYITFSGGIGYLVYSEDGETFSEPMYITPSYRTPRIALDDQSNIYLVWTDYRECGGWHGDIYFKKGIRTEPSNENGDDVQNNHQDQDSIDSWLWVIVAVILIALVAYIVKRKRSG